MQQQVHKSCLSQNLTQFSQKLYNNFPQNGDNIFYSPYNISTAMAMCYAGASNNTKEQMKAALNFNVNNLHQEFSQLNKQILEQNDVTLTTDNRLWPQQGYEFQQQYLDLVKKEYNSEVTQLNFAQQPEESRVTINQQVEKSTQEKIKDLIPSGAINPLTRMVITSCIYFKGLWKHQFKQENTKKADFILEDSQTVKTDFMNLNEKFDFYSDKQLSLLELPYKGDQFCLGVILPQEGIKIQQIEKYIQETQNFENIQQNTRNVKVNVSLPKFKFTYSLSLKESLQKLGMSEAFGSNADFQDMTGNKDLQISDVIHKAFIEVNEEGTEAAAATAVIMKMRCMPAPPQQFNANRPFIFYLKNIQTNTLLFFGKVNNPTL